VLLQRSRTREKIWVTTAGLTGLAKIATRTGRQIGLARLPGLVQTAARIDGQIMLAGLATQSRKQEVPVGLLTQRATSQKIRVTQKAGSWKIWLTRKAGLQKIQLTQKAGLRKIQLTRKARLRKIRLTWKTMLCRTQGGGQETGRRKRSCSKQKARFTVVPKGYYQDTKMQIAKDASKRIG
jgi:hypothetical protein